MTGADLKRLRHLAEKARSGEWTYHEPDMVADAEGLNVCAGIPQNAAFIAAANPQTVIALLDIIDEFILHA